MKKTRVLVVDDSALIRSVMTELLSSDPEIEVVGAAQGPVYCSRQNQKLESGRHHAGRGNAQDGWSDVFAENYGRASYARGDGQLVDRIRL